MSRPTPTGSRAEPGVALHGLREMFASRGLAGRVGYGERPALLVIDLQLGFTDPDSPLGADVDDTIAAAARLAEAARRATIPVIFTRCVWSEAAAVWARKLPPQRQLVRGSRWVEIDPRIQRQDNDIVVEKSFASAFFGTDLHGRLKELNVDTLLLSGVTTSGCVRASAVDGCSHGYRVIVAEEAVGDRAAEPHLMSLFDLDAKYADVTRCADLDGYLTSVAPLIR